MNEALIFRRATSAETPRIMEIITQAKAQMRSLGSDQWQQGYPATENIATDITRGDGWVLCQPSGGIVAYGAVIFDGEPAYDALDGEWLCNGKYVVVHRLAVADEVKQRGIAATFMLRTEELARQQGCISFRVDTNFDNRYMLRLLRSQGFIHCGGISYESGPRMAFEKRL